MKRKELITVSVCLFFILTLIALPLIPMPASAASGEPITLKFAHQNPPKGRTTVKLIDGYINRLREVTKGKLKIVVYPAQSLIKAKEIVTGIENGIADLAWTPLGYFTGRFPLTTVTMLPFMTLNTGGKNALVVQELYETIPEVQKEYRSVKVLSLHGSDGYHLATSKKPVRNLNDLKGLKMRIMGKYPINASKILGLSPLFMPMPAIYEAGEKGVLDGAALPWAAVATFNLFEVFPYWTDVDLWSAPFMIFMNKDKWNSLPKDIQEAITSISGMKAAKWLGDAAWGPDVKDETVAKAKKAGKKLERISLDPGELDKWKKIAGKPVWDAWVKQINKKGLPGQKVLDAAMRLMKKHK
ncbi:TRAP transporter substrate-binding protein [Thermodesulfobacteriota bacterium]